MNLFCSADHLRTWSEAHPNERGRQRDPEDVAELGRAEWAYLLDASAESCAYGDPDGAEAAV